MFKANFELKCYFNVFTMQRHKNYLDDLFDKGLMYIIRT